MANTHPDQVKQQLDTPQPTLADLDDRAARPANPAQDAAPMVTPSRELVPLPVPAAPPDTLRTLTRLLVGTALLGVDELARRAPDWERRAALAQGATGAATAPQPTPAPAAPAGVAPAAVSPSAGVEMRRALIGWMFAAQERLRAAPDPARWLGAAAGHMAGTAAALANESFGALLGGRSAGGASVSDPELAHWIALGREEEQRSLALARVALRDIVDDVFDAVAREPAVRELIQTQSLSMADEALGEVRERAVSADIFVDSLLRRILHRPRAQGLAAGDPRADMEPRE